jgi:hypothetical protein
MDEMHCRFCFKSYKSVEKHEAKCEGAATISELNRVVRRLVERVDAQDRLIAELSRPTAASGAPSAPLEPPTLTEADLVTFLRQGLDAMLAPYAWPVASHNRVTYVCECGVWERATDGQLKAVSGAVLGQLAQLFPAYVERKGWLENDPKGKYPESALKVYGIQSGAVQQALVRKAKANA